VDGVVVKVVVVRLSVAVDVCGVCGDGDGDGGAGGGGGGGGNEQGWRRCARPPRGRHQEAPEDDDTVPASARHFTTGRQQAGRKNGY
jgi:hypothetical protein